MTVDKNNNHYINDFISQSNININKLVALKDIHFSNSMIERVNYTLKYRYIFPKQPRDLKHLHRILRFFIHDYNTVKPHGKLKGLTPHEAWIGFHVDEKHRITLLKEARLKRIEYARANKCEKCTK